MGEYWQLMFQRARERCLPLRHLAPFAGSGLVVTAGFCSSRPLRFACLSVALILFLFVTADFARSLLDRSTGNASYQGPPKHIPVTPSQVFFTLIVAAAYFFMIFAGLHGLFETSGVVFFAMAPGIFLFSTLAAWRNVRLWYRDGADYEQALKEEAGQSHKLRIPPIR